MRRRLSHWEVLPPSVFAAFVALCWLRDYLPNPQHELSVAIVLLGLAVLMAGIFVSLWNRTIPKPVESFLFDLGRPLPLDKGRIIQDGGPCTVEWYARKLPAEAPLDR
jgi:hypothetical protein